MSIAKLKLRNASIPSMTSRHPWVLSTSLQKTIEPIAKDSVVELVDGENRFVGRGIFNPDSRIAVRVYSWQESETLDFAWLNARIETAIQLRKSQATFTSAAPYVARRLIFSEADRLSGLIVDAFGPYLVVQITAAATLSRLGEIVESLKANFEVKAIILKIEDSTAKKEKIDPRNETIFGEVSESELTIIENGILFVVDLAGGQKTGHYLDQRQNRSEAANWISSNSNVLDVCSYSGGFACTIAKMVPGCRITSIDSSQKALDMAARNAELNGLDMIRFEKEDFYQALDQRFAGEERFDAIILDPPRLAGSKAQVEKALAAYHRLNYSAVRLLKPGGILITCSCSGRVTRQHFSNMILGVSKRARREIQVLQQRSASDDHPILINCPETDYLKCYICKVF